MPSNSITSYDLCAEDLTVYAEDLPVDVAIPLGSRTLTVEEIVDFARQWDPQGFHIDEDIAMQGAFGGLIASGIQTIAVFQRLVVDAAMHRWAVIAGRTINEVQLTKPVRPGMELVGSATIERVEPRGPERALVHQLCRLTHDGESVLTFRAAFYMRRRTPTG